MPAPHPLSHLPQPSALLFDFDGVLVASKMAHQHAWRSAAQQLWGNDPGPYPRHLSGRSPREIAAYFCAQNGNSAQIEEYMETKLAYLLAQAAPPPLLPGVQTLFNHLHQHGLPFGIASNAPRAFVLQTVERHGLPVHVVLGFEDYDHPKPDPEPYLKLAVKLGQPSNTFKQCWIFEDSFTGLQAARSSTMCPIGVQTSQSAKALEAAGAQAVISDLRAVSAFLFPD